MQLSLFNELDVPVIHMVRRTDPETSKGAAEVTKRNAKTQRVQLLKTYYNYRFQGPFMDGEIVDLMLGRPATLQDEGIRRRASDLRKLGLIKEIGTAPSPSTGVMRMTCEITNEGITLIETMKDSK